jgi:hypothetical protein
MNALREQRTRARREHQRWIVDFDRREIERRRTTPAFIKRLTPFPVRAARTVLAGVVEDTYATDPKVVALRAFIVETCRRERIELDLGEVPALRYGSAWYRDRVVQCAPINSLLTAAVALHECGHILEPPDRHTRDVMMPDGGHACPQAEVRAWSWAMRQAPFWNRAMHDLMRYCLGTYRPYATGDEARTFDRLMSFKTFAEEVQRRALGLTVKQMLARRLQRLLTN